MSIDSLFEPNAMAALDDPTALAEAPAGDGRSPDEIIAGASEFFDVLASRRSIRHFSPVAPPRELVTRAIEAATLAPSGMNKQPWRFVVVANDAVKAEMVARVSLEIETILAMLRRDEYSEKASCYLRNYATLFRTAPVVINVLYREYGQVIASLLDRSGVSYPENQEEAANPAMQSVSAAIQNLMLAAHALGLATCWMTAPLFAREQLHDLLGVEEPWQLAAVVPIGYAAKPCTIRPRRVRFERVVRWIE